MSPCISFSARSTCFTKFPCSFPTAISYKISPRIHPIPPNFTASQQNPLNPPTIILFSIFAGSAGPAPQPPRRRNPPTELEIPCEFCGVPVPHEDLIQHETGCRPDLARFNPRRARSPSPDDYFVAPAPSSPEVELPCEFCADMIPASQLLRHQATCL